MKQAPKITTALLELDSNLYNSVNSIDILDAITPLNYENEKVKFFDSQYKSNPKFTYATSPFSLLQKKRALFNLPVEALKNDKLYQLYFEVIQSYADKLDQYGHLGTEAFLYDSMRYYGEPSEKDIKNAEFILHLANTQQKDEGEKLGAEKIVDFFEHFADGHNLPLSIEISDSMIANALVSGTLVRINRNANVTMKELKALAHHELGVHLVTTLNAQAQPLKILSLGSPLNTMAQEGVAILCEYLSGFMEVKRLRTLALRVKAVKSMIVERNFKTTFHSLMDEFGLTQDQAFALTARVYRGGGFTKDYVYLKGFQQILTAHRERKDFNNLLCGKVSLEQLSLITDLQKQGYLVAPKHISPALKRPASIDPVLQLVADSIN